MNSGFPTPTVNGLTVHWAPLLIHPVADGPECFVAPDLLIKPARLELLAGVREEGPHVRGAIEELALEARRRSVSVSRVESSEDAARRVIAMAA